MTESHPNHSRHSLFAVWRWPKWIWFVIAALMLVAYPLSLGPFIWLFEKGYISESTAVKLTFAYTPILLVVEFVPPLEPLLEQYAEWWTPPESR